MKADFPEVFTSEFVEVSIVNEYSLLLEVRGSTFTGDMYFSCLSVCKSIIYVYLSFCMSYEISISLAECKQFNSFIFINYIHSKYPEIREKVFRGL